MEEYQKNLFHMKGEERYAESFLIKLSSEETVKDAVLQGMIREAGKTVTLKLKNNKKKIKWSSSNKKVATVTKKGKVKGKKVGKATITAKVGKKKYKCKINVKKKVVYKPNNNSNNMSGTKVDFISITVLVYP